MKPSSPRVTVALCAGAFATALLLWWLTADPASARSNDALDYAQMGRQLATGEGFTTLQVFPRHARFLAENGLAEGPWPNLHRYPLPTVLDALTYRLTGSLYAAGAWQSGLSYAACASAFALLLSRFAPALLTALGTGLLLLHPTLYAAAHNGLTENTATALLLLVLAAVARPTAPSARDALLAGVACGLAWLTRTQLAVLLPLAALLAGLRQQSWRGAAWVVFGAALPVAPWALRNLWLVGDPLFSFSTTRNLLLGTPVGDLDMQAMAPWSTGDVLALHGDALRDKIVDKQLPRAISPAAWLAQFDLPALLALPALAALLATARRHRALAAMTLVLPLASFLAVSLAFHSERFYDPLDPLPLLWLTLGVAALAERFVAHPRRGLALASGLLVLAAALWSPQIHDGPLVRRWGREPRAVREPLSELAAQLDPDDVVASDVSAHTAAVGLRSLRLPEEPADLVALDTAGFHVDVLVFSSRIARDARKERGAHFANYGDWHRLSHQAAFAAEWVAIDDAPHGYRIFRRREATLRPTGRPASPGRSR